MIEEFYARCKSLLISKISFGVDGWRAPNFCSYYGVTAHFLDDEWNLISFALDLIPSEGQHAGLDIARLFLECVKFDGIQRKIGGISLDNASANTTFIRELCYLLASEKIEFNVDDQHFRCLAHVLNLAIQDLFKAMNVICPENCVLSDVSPETEVEDFENHRDDDEEGEENLHSIALIINKVRKTFKRIRRSEDLMKKLNDRCGANEIKFLEPKIDVKTRIKFFSDCK